MLKRLPQEYLIHSILYISFIIFAFFLESPKEILNGLYNIISNSDILITDYISIGGFGATLINSALLGLIFIFLFYITFILFIYSTFTCRKLHIVNYIS